MTSSTENFEWELDDGAARAEANPYTFWRPSKELIDQLQPGDFVKLIFLLPDSGPKGPDAERMWVEITGRTLVSFAGNLDSQPEYFSSLRRGSVIEFQEQHIIDASIDDPIPDPTVRWMPRCFVTNRVLEDGEQVGYLYREKPDREEDSGWRFMCGDETDEYMNEVENIQLVSLGAVLRCDDRILPLLDHAAPVAFRWNSKLLNFVPDEMPEQR